MRTTFPSSDNDPIFRYHRWHANLRIPGAEEIKSIPYTSVSHPFVERLIGTIRREYLDRAFFWNAQDLERKLGGFLQYYNHSRVHQTLDGGTPAEVSGGHQPLHAKPSNYSWISDCNGLFQTPVACVNYQFAWDRLLGAIYWTTETVDSLGRHQIITW